MGHKGHWWVTSNTQTDVDRDGEKNTSSGHLGHLRFKFKATVVSDSIHSAFIFYFWWLLSPLSDEWMADEELESSLLTGGSIAGGDRKSPTINRTHINPSGRRTRPTKMTSKQTLVTAQAEERAGRTQPCSPSMSHTGV